ncbi:Ribitol-5-phosphate cytidylyltransferase [bioreactor metagenome]|uniref:Ribitol-5-phosphate cytidylyltransferase n=1 Tax=bioreactor metagenome TaxID=1076179 RepID=A0A644XJL0_9ZZZZ
MNIGLILAGGLGLRMNQEGEPPKQFFMLGGKPVLIHTLDKFEQHPSIDAVCIVCLSSWENYLWDLIHAFGLKKIRWIVTGGDCRQQSVYNGLCALEKDCSGDDVIVVHDGVRPFITDEIITQNIQTALAFGNAMTSMRSTDTLILSDDGKRSSRAMERDLCFTVQTPQTYRLSYGLSHYRRAYELGRTGTINCCELFVEMGEEIYIVNGRKTNIKLTTQDDIAYLKALHMIFYEDLGE